jgi:hypothetical protein
MWDEPTGWRLYALLVPVLVIIGAGVWWRVSDYRTNVGLVIGGNDSRLCECPLT